MASSTKPKLVCRLNDSWGLYEVNGHLIPLLDDPRWMCPVHLEPLLIHDFSAFKDSRGFCHIDAHVKCPRCDWFQTFGIRFKCDDDLLQRVRRSKYHGKVLIDELIELMPIIKMVISLSDDTIRYVEETIRSWGYW